MSRFIQQFRIQADVLIEQNLHRKRQVIHNNKDTISFSSNDYLSLTSNEEVRAGYLRGFSNHPVGSGGSLVVSGYHETHHALEHAFKEALRVEDCLLFSSGYAANLGVMNLLAQSGAALLVDKAVHASIYDGLSLSQVPYTRYLHHDLGDLACKLQRASDNTVVMTESVFSMSGKKANLKDMVALSNCPLLVDEAHAFGVFGEAGLGCVSEAHLAEAEVPLRVIPFGKALGGVGAIVAGSGVWIDALLQSARSAIYSTALSPAFAYGLMVSFEVLMRADYRREKLNHLIQYFREAIKKSSLQWSDSSSPIQQLQLGCPKVAIAYANCLQAHAIICLPMRQPTVSKKHTGLRIILNYHHEPAHIDKLFNVLHELALKGDVHVTSYN